MKYNFVSDASFTPHQILLSGDQIKKSEMGGAYGIYGGKEMCVRGFGGPEGKRPLGRPRHRWENNIKMVFQELGWWDIYWLGLAHDRDRWRALVNAVMNLQVP
jgi:hypothetical protein